MQHKNETQKQDKIVVSNARKKKRIHDVIVYIICLIIACVTWFSVHYSVRVGADQAPTDGASLSTNAIVHDEILYV